ncbi:MAG: hypothetical protein ACP6IY_04735 [Promethearchaeia archaeon]
MVSHNLDAINIDRYLNKENFYEEIDFERRPTQGDIIIPYRPLLKEYKGKNIIGIIIITNSCDIEHNVVKYIAYVPIYRASDMINFSNKKDLKNFKKIIQQNHKSFFYLPPHPIIDDKIGGLIYFENILSEKIDLFYKKYPKPSLKLKRPFIDRLCLKIANFFNRILINHPTDADIQNWINENELIQRYIKFFKLQLKCNKYISREAIKLWINENYSFQDCENILKLYIDAQKYCKKGDIHRLEVIIDQLNKIVIPPYQESFSKLKEDLILLKEL